MGMVWEVKVMKCGKDIELEKDFVWLRRNKGMEFPLAALRILKMKALELHKQFHELRSNTSPETEFNSSQGWFSRFCKRHNIRQLPLKDEQFSTEQPAADRFYSEFK